MSNFTSSAAVVGVAGLAVASLVASLTVLAADPLPPDSTYQPLRTLPLSPVEAHDEAHKPEAMQRQGACSTPDQPEKTISWPVC